MIKRGKPTKNGQVKLTFTIPEGDVHGAVSVVGDFNGWDPYAHPMQRKEDGTYQVSLTVPAQQPIRFRYLADGGVWFDDADADHHDEHGGRLNPIGSMNSMKEQGVPAKPAAKRTVKKPARQALANGSSVAAPVAAS
ncbi:isoamylase early set domain-containing protein [Streptosporangium fragile]|uniref:Isoamylase early set domain-containing protein n=1 Tax=Streptosporangium fragile TaxID=46186 RepID=A0ABP6IEV7_9ACTN